MIPFLACFLEERKEGGKNRKAGRKDGRKGVLFVKLSLASFLPDLPRRMLKILRKVRGNEGKRQRRKEAKKEGRKEGR
jgi:hypothetical protein